MNRPGHCGTKEEHLPAERREFPRRQTRVLRQAGGGDGSEVERYVREVFDSESSTCERGVWPTTACRMPSSNFVHCSSRHHIEPGRNQADDGVGFMP